MIQSNVQLDTKGLACPMPIVKTKKVMNEVAEGQVLEVQATDSGSVADLAAWSKKTGHQYIGSHEENGVYFHYIRKCSEANETAEKTFEQTATNEEAIASGALILDVREAAEFAFGHIPGAKSIPMGELEARMNELNKEDAIYVICRTGTRSDMAAQQLAQAGFTAIKNVLPGMSAYEGELQKEV
ncbi:MAG: sulfurtransferase TusA family protein [Caryophanon sp.]|nr:sulfurtransferase TusA family protein [Caryophanon sp.]